MAETIVTKRCSTCKQTLPVSDFYKSSSRPDNLQCACKKCCNAATMRCRNTDRGRHKFRETARTDYIRHREERIQKVQAYVAKFPEKQNARNAIGHLVESKRLPKASAYRCRRCRNQARVFHHHLGYCPEHWLDVVPVCSKCHKIIHINADTKGMSLTPIPLALEVS